MSNQLWFSHASHGLAPRREVGREGVRKGGEGPEIRGQFPFFSFLPSSVHLLFFCLYISPLLSLPWPCGVIDSWGAMTSTTSAVPRRRCAHRSAGCLARTARLNIWSAGSTVQRMEFSVMGVRHMAEILLWKSLGVPPGFAAGGQGGGGQPARACPELAEATPALRVQTTCPGLAWRWWRVACWRCLRRSCRSWRRASIFRRDNPW
jgi:hypothetical protein